MSNSRTIRFNELPNCVEWTAPNWQSGHPSEIQQAIGHLWFLQRDDAFEAAIEPLSEARKVKFYAGSDIPRNITCRADFRPRDELQPPLRLQYSFTELTSTAPNQIDDELEALLSFAWDEEVLDQIEVGFDLKVSPFSEKAMNHKSTYIGSALDIPDSTTQYTGGSSTQQSGSGSFEVAYDEIPRGEVWPLPLWTTDDYRIAKGFLKGIADSIPLPTQDERRTPPEAGQLDYLTKSFTEIRKLNFHVGLELREGLPCQIEPREAVSVPGILRGGASALPDQGEWGRIRVELRALADRIEADGTQAITWGFDTRVTPFSSRVTREKSIQL